MTRLARGAAALGVHAALVVWLTWPFAAHLGTHLPSTNAGCEWDTPYMGWALAHESHTLVTAPARLADANIYHPTRHALFYGDTGFGALPYFLPTYLLTGNPTLALNLVFLGCVTLTAWALHLVTVAWTASELAGFVAGWTYLTTRWVLWGLVPSAPSYAVLQYLPLIVLLAAAPVPRVGLLLPLVALQCLTDVAYVAAAVLVPLGVLGVVRLVRRTSRRGGLHLLGVVAVAPLLLLPVYAGHLAVRAANPDLARQSLWATSWEPMWLPRGLFSLLAPTAVAPAALLLTVAGAASAALPSRTTTPRPAARAWAHALFWTVVALVASLTPRIYWYGRPIELPHAMLSRWLPIYDTLREPIRLGVGALVGLSLLAGLGFAECVRRLPARGRLAAAGRIVAMLVIGGIMYRQYSGGVAMLRTSPVPPVYPVAEAVSPASPVLAVLRQREGPLLELPLDPAHVLAPGFHVRAMYRSIFHWRPLLNGYSSYWPVGFPERMALAARLPDPDALATLRRETGVETILVHLPADRAAPVRAAWLPLAERPGDGIHLIARDGDDLLFAVGDGRPRE